jgi:hypothetical protein
VTHSIGNRNIHVLIHLPAKNIEFGSLIERKAINFMNRKFIYLGNFLKAKEMERSKKSLVTLLLMLIIVSCDKDIVAPTLSILSITSGVIDLNNPGTPAANVSVTLPIEIAFTADVDASTATSANISLKEGMLPVEFAVAITGSTLTITPVSGLNFGLTYTLSIMSTVMSDKGATLENPVSVSFTTSEPDFCRLVKEEMEGAYQITYTYNSAGQVYQQVYFQGGVFQSSFVFFYNTDGLIEKVVSGPGRAVETGSREWVYSSTGKISEVRSYTDSSLYNTDVYTWSENQCKIASYRPGLGVSLSGITYEFLGENIVRTASYLVDDHGGSRGTTVIETTWSQFDSNTSMDYFLSLRRPGYSIVSKNNPGLVSVKSYRRYIWGNQDTQESQQQFTYTYNSQNITTSSGATEYKYESCN